MKKTFISILLLWISIFSFSQKQEHYSQNADYLVKGAEYVIIEKDFNLPYYIRLREDINISTDKLIAWMKEFYKSNERLGFSLKSFESDQQGYIHYRYQQTYNNIPVEFAIYIAHTKNNKLISLNGDAFCKVQETGTFSISETEALNLATTYIGAEKYKWEIPDEEAFIKKETNNPKATYFPTTNQVYFPIKQANQVILKPAYRFDIYAQKPLSRSYVYIDASTGKVLFENKRIRTANAIGTAHTRYSGVQIITTDSFSSSYRLRETGRGNGIETYNMQLGSNYNSATDFTDNDNNWNNVNSQMDEVATDTHWATEKAYDYFFFKFGRNSIDNNGFALKSYIHADLTAFGLSNNINAFWDGSRMTYGDGNGTTYFPQTSIDICGHEITHGLTENTANLIYQNESGALCEGFSDIFGTAIEFYGKQLTANWTQGEDCGPYHRNASNPNAIGDPDTYRGVNWDSHEEVHKNSTVLSYWFYLLSSGGDDINDIGNSYSFTGIGINDASSIAYRTLAYYLTPYSCYSDARFYSILSAVELFGACKPEVDATVSAWYAVGLGGTYEPDVVSDFTTNITSYCSTPFTANFQNMSINSTEFLWNFGDGTTSTDINPSHTYNNYGRYTVTMYAYGGSCGSDTMTKEDFIFIDSTFNCTNMPYSGTGQTQTTCSGILYDNGGPDGNYSDMTDVSLTIAPPGASHITINFVNLDIESGDNGYICNLDYIAVYDGPSVTSNLIGKYCNTSGSPGTITSSTGAITIRQYSNQTNNKAGFEMTWQCEGAPPDSKFSADFFNTCSGNIHFVDMTTNYTTGWLWDFGDGTFSTNQNPLHTYLANGNYSVKLISTNQYGSDSLEKQDYILVDLLDVPIITGDTINPGETAIIYANASGNINWFDSITGGSLIFHGDTLSTTVLQNPTVFYAENSVDALPRYFGKVDSSGVGNFYSNPVSHYLIFDCFRPSFLSSVKVYADGAGMRTILLTNSNEDILGMKKVWVTDGESRVALNFNLPIANNYRLVCDSISNLYRNGGSNALQLSYPYLLDSTLSIKGNSANNLSSYYYFYDWKIIDASCVSRRIPVTAFVNDYSGVNELGNYSFAIFPNPAENEFYINCYFSTETELHIELLNMNGQMIQNLYNNKDVSGNQTLKFNTSDLSGGIYLISISGKDFNILRKLVIM